jgi:hypothetical protein
MTRPKTGAYVPTADVPNRAWPGAFYRKMGPNTLESIDVLILVYRAANAGVQGTECACGIENVVEKAKTRGKPWRTLGSCGRSCGSDRSRKVNTIAEYSHSVTTTKES